MGGDIPKVLHEVAGMPMLVRVLETARALRPRQIYVVVAPDQTEAIAAVVGPDARLVVQDQPEGTGRALKAALDAMLPDATPDLANHQSQDADADAELMVMCGDTPLLRATALASMRALFQDGNAAHQRPALVVLTAQFADSHGYGCIVRDESGTKIKRIDELSSASPTEPAVLPPSGAPYPRMAAMPREINAGVYLAKRSCFSRWVSRLTPDAATGEYYLTDIVTHADVESCADADAESCATAVLPLQLIDPLEALGVNTRAQLARTEIAQQHRLAAQLLEAGVTLADPERLTVRGDVRFGQNCFVDVGAVLIGPLRLGNDVRIGAYSVISRSQIGDRVDIQPHTHIHQSRIGCDVQIGPFAHIRDHSVLQSGVTIGNFVETKAADLGEGSTAKHLAYLGNVKMGGDVNVAAGTITCNYDGFNKNTTAIGNGVFIGSNTTLVAPVRIDDGAYIAAGSVITKDVGQGEMAITRTEQKHRPPAVLARLRRQLSRRPPTTDPADATAPADPAPHTDATRHPR